MAKKKDELLEVDGMIFLSNELDVLTELKQVYGLNEEMLSSKKVKPCTAQQLQLVCAIVVLHNGYINRIYCRTRQLSFTDTASVLLNFCERIISMTV